MAYVFNYQYSLSDRLKQIQYPSGRTVNYVPDTAGRISAVQNGATLANYATLTYTAPGGISAMSLGNGLTEQLAWNDRLQVTSLTVGSALTLGFHFCPSLAPPCPSGNNGTLRGQTITAPGLSETQSYAYDNLDRLTGVSVAGGSWKEGYRYDNSQGQTYGNRWVDENPSIRSGLPPLTQETPKSPSWYLGNNQITGWTPDAAGNILNLGTQQGALPRSFTYDAQNLQLTATINGVVSNYTYDGEGQRVQKSANGVVTTYLYDAWGELAAEYSTQGGTSACGTTTCYVTVDHLGSTRLLTNNVGAVARRYDYLPFGEELLAGTGGRTTAMGYQSAPDGFNPKFTGQMRDPETGFDYFHARYYSAAQGRFTGVDPENAGASLGNPQTLNGYAYVGNNPLTYTDPSGEGWLKSLGIGLSIGAALFTGGASSFAVAVLGVSTHTAGIVSTVLLTGASLANGGTASIGINAAINANNQGVWSEQLPSGGALSDPTVIQNLSPTNWRRLANAADLIAGFADTANFGIGRYLRSKMPGGDPRNLCSPYYAGGVYASLGTGVGRMAYAGSAKALSAGALRGGAATMETASAVREARNSLKVVGRLGFFRNQGMMSEAQSIAKYGQDPEAIIRAAGRTSRIANTYGAGMIAAGANFLSGGACRE